MIVVQIQNLEASAEIGEAATATESNKLVVLLRNKSGVNFITKIY